MARFLKVVFAQSCLACIVQRTKDGLVFFLCDGTWFVLQSFNSKCLIWVDSDEKTTSIISN